ncbi:uncharacterized protein LOC119871969 isoform X1 [Canis lupus familiaris]|uniref:uncharacterized protein LOC119871969 isoform X1 n=1 Tax=Canis lupus familiaris TaxID=9615 RepID=UPI0018F56C0C|nr:uncharacterized protein LOC119871969 isoform X1 [Canis lupus familiaris]XP_038523417.1 uncharacterized protein LOC119871969 isoform X1 [Canis lupus familiaris]
MAAPPADPAPAAPHSLPPPGTAGSRRPLHVSTKHLERVPQARAQGGAGGRCGPGTAASPPPLPGVQRRRGRAGLHTKERLPAGAQGLFTPRRSGCTQPSRRGSMKPWACMSSPRARRKSEVDFGRSLGEAGTHGEAHPPASSLL